MDERKLKPCVICKSPDVAYQHGAISGEHHIECQACGVLYCFPVDLTSEEVRRFWENAERTPAAAKVFCVECGWEGVVTDLKYDACPSCHQPKTIDCA